QRGLAGAGRPGQELKRMGLDLEIQVAQDFGAESVPQSHVFESDHAAALPTGCPPLPATAPPRFAPPKQDSGPRRKHAALRRHEPAATRSNFRPCLHSHGFRSVNGRVIGSEPKAGPPRITMLIDCPNCATSYQVDAASIGARGRSVRCARCLNVWFAEPTDGA